MKTCSECSGKMKEMASKTPDGVPYNYFKCRKCGEEVLNMAQLHLVTDKYRNLKRYSAKLSKWGQSLGLRIPKDLAKKYNFKDDGEVTIVPEEGGIKIISA